MKSKIFKRSLLTTVWLFALVVVAPNMASAQSARAEEMRTQVEQGRGTRQVTQADSEEMQSQRSERRAEAQGRLEDAKLKTCERRQELIVKILERFSTRGDKHLEVFTKISDRVQAFYTEKGYVLENYDTLVEDVTAKKAAAEVAIEGLHDTSHEFSCEGEDPKGVVSAFKDKLKVKNAALKEYRVAIKDLIVGVKSVQPSESTEETTEGSQE